MKNTLAGAASWDCAQLNARKEGSQEECSFDIQVRDAYALLSMTSFAQISSLIAAPLPTVVP